MIRTVLLAMEILLAVGALGAGTAAIVQGRDALTGGEGLTAAKRQVLVDAGLAGVVVAVMVVAFTTETPVAAAPPMVTEVAPVKLVPVMVTLVPPASGPPFGLIAVTVGAA